jgi:hypothetical protein
MTNFTQLAAGRVDITWASEAPLAEDSTPMNDPRAPFASPSQPPQRTQVLPASAWQPPQQQQAQPWPPQQPYQQQWPQPQQWPQQPVPPQAVDPSQPSSDEKNSALGAYLGALFMPVVLPIVIMVTAGNKRFQRAAALQALIVQLSTIVILVIVPFFMMALMFASRGRSGLVYLVYLPIMAVYLYSIVFGVMGMAGTQQGKITYAPLIGRRLAKTFRAEWP